jgi:cytochrome c-type biogenesis protein CcmH/NrfG
LLLDRKRIRRWARWVAVVLAVIFAASFLFIGVGQGTGNLNVFEAFSCANSKTTTNSTDADSRITALKAALAQNPKDLTNLQALATAYIDKEDYTDAAAQLEQVISIDPTQQDVYFRLATLYMNSLSDYASAVTVLNKAQAQFPSDPDVYLQLGLAQRSSGNNSAAILAWQKYLQLEPNGDQADAIREAIATMSASATTTTTSATTSTTAGTTSSTTGSTAGSKATAAAPTTTAAPTTSTTAPPTTTSTS